VSEAQINPDELKRYAFSVWSYKQGEMVSLMIHIGDRLGLYQALAGAGPVTAAELAAQTGLKERWLFEWLRGQAAARLLDYHDGDRFELTPVGAAVLADEQDSLAFAAGAFSGQTPPETVDKLIDAFKTGIGLSYEELGPNAAHRTERMLGPWTRQELVPKILPALDGVVTKLEQGAVAADVGCGGNGGRTNFIGVVRNYPVFVVAHIESRLKDFHFLTGELGPFQPSDQLFGLSRKHGTTDHLDPAELFFRIYGVFQKHSVLLKGRIGFLSSLKSSKKGRAVRPEI